MVENLLSRILKSLLLNIGIILYLKTREKHILVPIEAGKAIFVAPHPICIHKYWNYEKCCVKKVGPLEQHNIERVEEIERGYDEA